MKKKVFLNLLIAEGTIATGIIAVLWKLVKTGVKEQVRLCELSDKHLNQVFLLNQWIKARQNGKILVDYFEKNGIQSIAIYGMSYIGERLYAELSDSDIEIKYIIDRQVQKKCAGLRTFSPDDNLPEVGAIVVTAVFFFDEIKDYLGKRGVYRIISLEDIIYGA